MITEDRVMEIVRDELDTRYLNEQLSFIVRHNPKGMIKLAKKWPNVEIIQQYAKIAEKAIYDQPLSRLLRFFRGK